MTQFFVEYIFNNPMIRIEHKVNTIEKLMKTPRHLGVEVDVRDYDGEICLAHDPFNPGISLSSYLNHFNHKLIIFNVKCSGIESKIIELAHEFKIDNFFLLDVQVPSMVSLANNAIHDFAIRYSVFEPIEGLRPFIGIAKWVWIDCFKGFHLNKSDYQILSSNFKLCIVSPELQGFHRRTIKHFKDKLRNFNIDAVCSDFCEDWK